MSLIPGDAACAIIITDDGKYLLQLRDDIEGIWFPGHWGLFGGAIEQGETPEEALVREVREELSIEIELSSLIYFTRYDFDFGFAGYKAFYRNFYIINIKPTDLESAVLGEGEAMQTFSPVEISSGLKITPYDSFGLWMHINQSVLN